MLWSKQFLLTTVEEDSVVYGQLGCWWEVWLVYASPSFGGNLSFSVGYFWIFTLLSVIWNLIKLSEGESSLGHPVWHFLLALNVIVSVFSQVRTFFFSNYFLPFIYVVSSSIVFTNLLSQLIPCLFSIFLVCFGRLNSSFFASPFLSNWLWQTYF